MADQVYNPPENITKEAHCKSLDQYKELYQQSVDNPELFWSNIAEDFYWKEPYLPGKFLEYNFNTEKGPIFIKWLQGAKTNVCYNVLDRNIKDKGKGDDIAFYWYVNSSLFSK